MVRYVGLKDREFDKKGGTGMTWERGESKLVPFGAWEKMAKHPDVWALDTVDDPAADELISRLAGLSNATPVFVPQEIDDDDLTALRVSIVPAESSLSSDDSDKPADKPDLFTMQTAALREYAKAKGYDVDLTMKGSALRTAIAAIEG